MREDAHDHFRLLDARDHPQPSLTLSAGAGLDLDREHLLQTLRPAQPRPPLSRAFLARQRIAAGGAAPDDAAHTVSFPSRGSLMERDRSHNRAHAPAR